MCPPSGLCGSCCATGFALSGRGSCHGASGALLLVQAAGYAGAFTLLYPLVPASLIPASYLVVQCANLIFSLLMLWLTIRYVLGHGVESWLLVLALLSDWISWLAGWLTFLHVPRVFYPFGIFLSLAQVTGFLMASAMCALLVRRWVLSARAQRVMAQELKQAQEVQQVLIPEAIHPVPSLRRVGLSAWAEWVVTSFRSSSEKMVAISVHRRRQRQACPQR